MHHEDLDFCRCLLGGWIFHCIQPGYGSSDVAWRKLFRKLQWLCRERQYHRHYMQLPKGKWHHWQDIDQFWNVHRVIFDKQQRNAAMRKVTFKICGTCCSAGRSPSVVAAAVGRIQSRSLWS